MSWLDDLQPASWRGIPFGVLSEGATAGRSVAVHEYPFRDRQPVWAEDTGRAARTFQITGFIVGDDVAARRARLLDAADLTAGPGELVHPQLGSQTVTLLRFASQTRWDLGRVVELSFEFVESGERLYPEAAADTQLQVDKAADDAALAAGDDYAEDMGEDEPLADITSEANPFAEPEGGLLADIGDALSEVGDAVSSAASGVVGAVSDVVSDVSAAVEEVEGAISSAVGEVVSTVDSAVGSVSGALDQVIGSAYSVVSGIVAPVYSVAGGVARAIGGALGEVLSFGGLAVSLSADAASVLNTGWLVGGAFGRYDAPSGSGAMTEAKALASATAVRGAVRTAAARLAAQVNANAGVPWAAQNLMAAAAAAQPNPSDRMRAFSRLAFAPGMSPAATLCRRLATVALARAAAAYQPTSADDATATLGLVCDALDLQIVAAGDARHDASYAALRALRVASIADLTARGASLAPLKTVTFGEPLPALVVAAQLYGSAPRADELVRRVDPVHPLFMPTTMTVLAT